MRRWYKYWLADTFTGRRYLAKDEAYDDHKAAMGGYTPDEAYRNKTDFFNSYFFGYHQNRLECYNFFLRKYLSKNDEILSIASGRCANELFLMEHGYKITCSDLGVPEALEETRKLFPGFKFLRFDVLSDPCNTKSKYDVIICLSLIYLFDEKDLACFFRNISENLKPGGRIILDSAASTDSLLSHMINEKILKYETMLIRLIKGISAHKRSGYIVKHMGYRRTDREIVNAAKQSGFHLCGKENYAYLTELKRSYFLGKIIECNSLVEKAFMFLGKRIPYIRMFVFEKMG